MSCVVSTPAIVHPINRRDPDTHPGTNRARRRTDPINPGDDARWVRPFYGISDTVFFFFFFFFFFFVLFSRK